MEYELREEIRNPLNPSTLNPNFLEDFIYE